MAILHSKANDTSSDIAVALVDDHILMREGLAQLVEDLDGYTVVLQAEHGMELVRAMNAGWRFAIALVDLSMPVMDGFKTIAWLKEHQPDVRAVALSFQDDEHSVLQAMRAGARGFIPKDIEPEELKETLDMVMAKGHHHSGLVARSLINGLERIAERERELTRIHQSITDRERLFLVLLCDPDEYSYQEIARRMGVSHSAVNGYRQAIGRRFGLHSRSGLVHFAVKWSVVST